ncbi:YidC/Oxa1 family membrane protein insertase [Caloramator quimbayensis]|uniref:YidC/Oxa1 family membrane protein insertase n=1 Tax=Caloramator quimbayensis TaxID=1147123 RepID=A0A1T4Y7E8_9CLOT|nr:membrane protein insertase YidC [Caloramator quimbayensis]SKA97448.1 YidC/Oxa1 family membrane protein insertase [Caloramator quimbayensis]
MNILVKPLTSFFDLINKFVTGIGITNLSVAYFLDIFIFTLIIRFLILPLTISQTKSTVKMGEIQPKLKELQDKYKNDPQKLQQKQMELYKEAGVNPLAGCLPVLVQFPIFIAMYYVIYNFKGFAGVPFLWVPSLSSPDKYFILPILSGVTTFLSGLMMQPKTDDPSAKTQKQMNIFMSIFFVYISYKFSAALVLYWIIGNFIQMLQQYFIINKIKHKDQEMLIK